MKNFPNISFINPDSLDGLNHLGKFLDEIQFLSGAIPSNQDGSHDPWDHDWHYFPYGHCCHWRGSQIKSPK